MFCPQHVVTSNCVVDSFFVIFMMAVQITKIDLMGSCIGFESIIFAINRMHVIF